MTPTNETILNLAVFVSGAVMAFAGAWLIGPMLLGVAFANLAVRS